MQARPPDEVLAWLTHELRCEAVVDVAAMPGGSTSALHRVTLTDGHGHRLVVVLRRYVVERILDENPHVARQEATALELVEASPVPTPKPLAADLDGRSGGAPSVVMEHLDGVPVWEPRRRGEWIDRIVETLGQLREIVVPADAVLPAIGRYDQRSWQPPGWAARSAVWERAIELFHRPVPEDDVGFVHRDFHPGNVLWRRGRL